MRSTSVIKIVVPMLFLGVAACSNSTGATRRAASVSFSGQGPAALAISADRAPNFDITVTTGANTLVITRAQIVIRSIKLKQAVTTACSDDDAVAEADCEKTKIGPVLADIPVLASGVTSLAVSIPEGTYREIEFKIHKPGSDAADAEFKLANPAFANISMQVTGTFNGTAFTFTSTLSEKEELEFNPPIVINADNQNVTIQMNLSTWFTVGGALVNPTTANAGGVNENAVKANIKASLKVLEDDNKDGK
jgi:hypothetical protein